MKDKKTIFILVIILLIMGYFVYEYMKNGQTPGFNANLTVGNPLSGTSPQGSGPSPTYYQTGGQPVFASPPGTNNQFVNEFSPNIKVSQYNAQPFTSMSIDRAYIPLFGLVGFSTYGTY